MCRCIENIIERTKAMEHAFDATVGSSNNQSSSVKYRPLKLNGEKSKVNRYTSAPWNYCPWCGENT